MQPSDVVQVPLDSCHTYTVLYMSQQPEDTAM